MSTRGRPGQEAHDPSTDEPAGLLEALLAATHLVVPDDVPTMLAHHARRIGVDDLHLYLVDYEARVLLPLPDGGPPRRDPAAVDGTLAGRCFQHLDLEYAALGADQLRTWVPLWTAPSASA